MLKTDDTYVLIQAESNDPECNLMVAMGDRINIETYLQTPNLIVHRFSANITSFKEDDDGGVRFTRGIDYATVN